MPKSLFIKALPVVLFGLGCALTLFLMQKSPAKEKSSAGKRERPSAPGLAVGEAVAMPEVASLDGGRAVTVEAGGKGSVCVLVSVECANCSIEAEFWRDLHRESADRGIGFYIISVDSDQSRVAKFVQAYGVEQLPVYFDPNASAIRTFKVAVVPQYLLIGAGGRILGRWDGVRRYRGKQQDFEKVAQMLQPLS